MGRRFWPGGWIERPYAIAICVKSANEMTIWRVSDRLVLQNGPDAPASILSLTMHQRIFNMNCVDVSQSGCPVVSYGDRRLAGLVPPNARIAHELIELRPPVTGERDCHSHRSAFRTTTLGDAVPSIG